MQARWWIAVVLVLALSAGSVAEAGASQAREDRT